MSERAFDWNDTIEKDSTFEILPEGDYDFTVISFERARHNGSEKLPPCNKAVLTIRVSNGEKTGTIFYNLFLHTKTEGMLCAFFTAIGHRKKGEQLRMDWSRVTGAKGRCKVGIRKWTGNNGQEMTSNDIVRFYEPDDRTAQALAPKKAFVPGSF